MFTDFGAEDNSLFSMSSATTIASCITAFCLVTVGLNVAVCYHIYKKRGLRSSSTAIIVANLACVDILVTLKDLPMFFTVSTTGKWYFEENWCSAYGLTNVIFIIVSVSTLVTVTTERYVRLRDLARPQEQANNSSRPVLLGYVIAHTTLSYSLSLLWSKYVFITRKAFCHVEWPPRQGFSFTFVASFIFIVPVSMLIYNLLYRNLLGGDEGKETGNDVIVAEKTADDDEQCDDYEMKAHSQLQIAVGLFLVSWSPYVIESMLSGYVHVSELAAVFTACIPLVATSLLPIVYMRFLRDDRPKLVPGNIVPVYVQ